MARSRFGWILEVVKRNEIGEFKILPKRWIVERTFAWISFQRRTSKDYERLTESSVAFIQLSMIHQKQKRLAATKVKFQPEIFNRETKTNNSLKIENGS